MTAAWEAWCIADMTGEAATAREQSLAGVRPPAPSRRDRVMLLPQEDRTAKLEAMEQLQEALGRAQKEVAQYADSDPTKVEAMSEP